MIMEQHCSLTTKRLQHHEQIGGSGACSENCCTSVSLEAAGELPIEDPLAVESQSGLVENGVQTSCAFQERTAPESQPGVVEVGVQTTCSFQQLFSDLEAQCDALEVERYDLEYPDAFLEDPCITEPDLDIMVDSEAQTSCSLEEYLIHVEAQRDILEAHRDALEQNNAFLEDRLQFMEAQLNHILHANAGASWETFISRNQGSAVVLRDEENRCVAGHYAQQGSLSSLSTRDSLSEFSSNITVPSASELVSSKQSSLSTLALFPLMQRGCLSGQPTSAPCDELHELPGNACLWFSLKSKDKVVGYACSGVLGERNGAARELENEPFSRSIASNAMRPDSSVQNVKHDDRYNSLRRQVARQCRQDHLMCKTGHYTREATSPEVFSKLVQAAPWFQLHARRISPATEAQHALSSSHGLGILLPVESLSKASWIWGRPSAN